MARIIKSIFKNRHDTTSSNKTHSSNFKGLENFVEDIVRYSDFTSIK